MPFGSGGYDRDDTSVEGFVIPEFVLNNRSARWALSIVIMTRPGIDGHPHGPQMPRKQRQF
jgi:hypothetical protein